RQSMRGERKRSEGSAWLSEQQPVTLQPHVRPLAQHELDHTNPAIDERAAGARRAEQHACRAHPPVPRTGGAACGLLTSSSLASASTAAANGAIGWCATPAPICPAPLFA